MYRLGEVNRLCLSTWNLRALVEGSTIRVTTFGDM